MPREDVVPSREEIYEIIKNVPPPPGNSSRNARNAKRENAIRTELNKRKFSKEVIDMIISDLPTYSVWEREPEDSIPREM